MIEVTIIHPTNSLVDWSSFYDVKTETEVRDILDRYSLVGEISFEIPLWRKEVLPNGDYGFLECLLRKVE